MQAFFWRRSVVLEHENLRLINTRRVRFQTSRAMLLGVDRVRKGFTLAVLREVAGQERLRGGFKSEVQHLIFQWSGVEG